MLDTSLIIRTAREEDLDALVALEHTVAQGLPSREMFVVDERAFYEPLLMQNNGQILLAEYENRIVGAGIVAFPRATATDNLGKELLFPLSLLERVVHIESVYILPEFRGKKLAQVLTSRNLELAAQYGRDRALSTVWPGNASSMSFLYELGLTVRKLTRKYGGLDRFIMLRTPEKTVSSGESVLIPCLDMDGHRKQLSQGMIGVGLRRHDGAKHDQPGNLAFSVIYRKINGDLSYGSPANA